tara:strand:- start:674 stop:1171 length:498 start_codon:yes stop_codon:yes gene_type:complete
MASFTPQNAIEFARAFNTLQNRGPIRSSTVGLPSYSQVFAPDSILGGTVAAPVVYTGAGASAQSPLGSFYDTGQNIMGFTQDMRNQSLFNQGQQIAMTAQALDPFIERNLQRTREGMLFSQNLDPNRQKQINSALKAGADMKLAQAAAQQAANQFGALQLQSNIV